MNPPTLSERAKDRLGTLARFIVLVPMFVLGGQVWGWAHTLWAEHWVHKDGTAVSAIVTQVNPKRLLDYRYTVDGKEYFGKDRRNWEDDRQHEAGIGEKLTAFVSSSRPAYSSLDPSHSAWVGLPIAVAIMIFELLLLGILLDGILRLFFGIRLHTGKPEDSVVVLIFAGALAVFMVLAVFTLRRNRQFKFILTRR